MKTKKLLAYRLSSPDIDAHFFENAPASVFCPQCNCVLDKSYVPEKIKLYSGRLPDLGGTYDGQALCSAPFKIFCEEQGLAIDFYEIDMGEPFYHFRPRNSLKYDTLKRGTRFINPCITCGNFAEVIGSMPVYFSEVFEPIQTGIYRTDIEFGSRAQKSAPYIFGIETGTKTKAMKFHGCTLIKIFLEEAIH